jgi:serine O-acetyltransferase
MNLIFINRDMLNDIDRADLYRYGGLVDLKGFLKGLMFPGFRYLYIYRKAQKYKNNQFIYFFFRLLKRRFKIKHGYEIDFDAQIGEGIYLSSHPGHVIVGPIRIGKYCNINHSVTIGRTYKNGKIGRPTIGDFVWIGTGAVIVGEIEIGKNVLIAPNSYVNFDVPENSLVLGNPAKIYPKENPTKYYINYILNETIKLE